MTAEELGYLTLDFNTQNFPLDMDYLFDVTWMTPATGPDDSMIADLREFYNECWEDLMDKIADELPKITKLSWNIAKLQDFCHRAYWTDESDTTYD